MTHGKLVHPELYNTEKLNNANLSSDEALVKLRCYLYALDARIPLSHLPSGRG